MGNHKDKRKTPKTVDGREEASTGRAKARRTLHATVNLSLLIALVVLGWLAFRPEREIPSTPPAPEPAVPRSVRRASSLDKLLAMGPNQLADVDIAEMNLLCARGLPGSEKLNIDHCLAAIDRCAAKAAGETHRALRFGYDASRTEAQVRAEVLFRVLRAEMGFGIDPNAAGNLSFNDSRSAFVGGMIPPVGKAKTQAGGSLVSLPVLFVAAGRRLGYPLKLVTAKGHLFVRWEGDEKVKPTWRERFNIELVPEFTVQPDLYYTSGPLKATVKEAAANRYLVSLTPAEELAQFLVFRGHCALENGQATFAARCYENACGYDPSRRCFREWFLDVALRCGYKPDSPALARLLARRKAVERQREEMMARLRRPPGGNGGATGPGGPGFGPDLPELPGLSGPGGAGPTQPGMTPPRTNRQPPWAQPGQPGGPGR